MKIRLIAFDMDGTFLADDKTCPPANLDAIKQAADKGVHIVPSSGRLFDALPDELKALEFVRYAITVNGADVYDRETGEHIKLSPVSPLLSEAVFDYLDTLPVIYSCYLDGKGWVDRRFYEMWPTFIERESIRHLMYRTRTPVEDFRNFVRSSGKPVQKITAMFQDMALREKVKRDLAEKFPQLAVTSSLYNNIEVNDADANKGSGLMALCRHLGVDPAETMAIGDDLNDVSMLRAARLGVAVRNAEAAVKQAADVVTQRTNDQGAVAEAVRRFVTI